MAVSHPVFAGLEQQPVILTTWSHVPSPWTWCRKLFLGGRHFYRRRSPAVCPRGLVTQKCSVCLNTSDRVQPSVPLSIWLCRPVASVTFNWVAFHSLTVEMTRKVCRPVGGAGHSLSTRVHSASSSDFPECPGHWVESFGHREAVRSLKVALPVRSNAVGHLRLEAEFWEEAAIGPARSSWLLMLHMWGG